MKEKYKIFIKLNLVSLVLIAISFISVTLAWFAYSGLARVSTEVNVKAWYIELEKKGEIVSNDVVISLSELYPGMKTVTEEIIIRNMGDSDAELNYGIISARILDSPNDFYEPKDGELSSETIEEMLSHKYPFNINISISKNYILAKGHEEKFTISISWPLDSDNDQMDSEWGNKAHIFQLAEEEKRSLDSSYAVQPSIKIEMSIEAQQYLEVDESSDIRYNLGDEILFDVNSGVKCESISSTCINFYIIDKNNTLGDKYVNLIPNPLKSHDQSSFDNYLTTFNNYVNTWNIPSRPLLVNDLLYIVSGDIINSFLISEGNSNIIIGKIKTPARIETEVNKVVGLNGFYRFNNEKYDFLSSSTCYWTNSDYGTEKGFALIREDDNTSKLYGSEKNRTCKVIPVVTLSKNLLN